MVRAVSHSCNESEAQFLSPPCVVIIDGGRIKVTNKYGLFNNNDMVGSLVE